MEVCGAGGSGWPLISTSGSRLRGKLEESWLLLQLCFEGRGPNRRELQIAIVGILMYIFSAIKLEM